MKLIPLSEVSYLRDKPDDGRPTIVSPFHEAGVFYVPLPVRDGVAFHAPVAFVQGSYLSEEPADPETDLHVPLIELIVQRLPFQRLLDNTQGLVSDVLNFGAVLEKYDLIDHTSRDRQGASILVATELEFLFYNVRSLFDELQRLIRIIWDESQLVDTQLRKKELPKSFRDVVLFGQKDDVRHVEEITRRYGLPLPIATFYNGQAAFFKLCRDVRDNIVHRGHSFNRDPIYPLAHGFAVDITEAPYSQLDCWVEGSLYHGKLGSVRALVLFGINIPMVRRPGPCPCTSI